MSELPCPRPDLLHLSPEALAQVANLGVVKRAVRELDGGYRPELSLDAEATLVARFSDGLVTTWARGKPIQHSHCSCGAASVCRHRIIAALAYRAEAAAAVPEGAADSPDSPGRADDDTLRRLIPPQLLQAAERQREQGLSVDLRRRASGEPCDTARLPSATVRFWAGSAIEAARCDCIHTTACDHLALGVWAFRQADAEQPQAASAQVRLGHAGSRFAVDAVPYHALIESLLRHGVTQGVAPLVQALSTAAEAARGAGTVWLDHLLADIEAWASSYSRRSALYEPGRGLDLLAELSLRLGAGGLPGHALAVLGVGQVQETALDRLRLMCLGARTERDGEQRRTRLVMGDIDTGTRMIICHDWSVPEARLAQEATQRAAERLAPGVRLEQLAQGQVLAQQARRLADGSLRLAKARSSQNSVLPQAADWSLLRPPLRFDAVAQLVEHRCTHPTAALQPRHAAGQFTVFSPAGVDDVLFDPNEQAVVAVLRDRDGRQLVVKRIHEQHTRHALDALAGALCGHFGPLRHVAGVLRWERGVAQIEAWALACDGVVVPDFSGPCGALDKLPLGSAATEGGDPVGQALAQLRGALGGLLHHGVSRLPRSWCDEAAALGRQLRGLGLHALAQQLEGFTTLLRAASAHPASARLAADFAVLVALLQLHEDAQVVVAGQAAAA